MLLLILTVFRLFFTNRETFYDLQAYDKVRISLVIESKFVGEQDVDCRLIKAMTASVFISAGEITKEAARRRDARLGQSAEYPPFDDVIIYCGSPVE